MIQTKKIKTLILFLLFSGLIHSQEQQITIDFKLDSLGCRGLREKYMVKSKDYKAGDSLFNAVMKRKKKVEIIQLLGKPNAIAREEQGYNTHPDNAFIYNYQTDEFIYNINCKETKGVKGGISIFFNKRGKAKKCYYEVN